MATFREDAYMMILSLFMMAYTIMAYANITDDEAASCGVIHEIRYIRNSWITRGAIIAFLGLTLAILGCEGRKEQFKNLVEGFLDTYIVIWLVLNFGLVTQMVIGKPTLLLFQAHSCAPEVANPSATYAANIQTIAVLWILFYEIIIGYVVITFFGTCLFLLCYKIRCLGIRCPSCTREPAKPEKETKEVDVNLP